MFGQIRERVFDGAEGVCRRSRKSLSGGGQFDARPCTDEELLTQMLFERCNGVADRRLGDAQFLRCPTEASQSRRNLEGE
jgi:hypothetical protein